MLHLFAKTVESHLIDIAQILLNRVLKDYEKPRVINTDKSPTYGPAITALKAEGKCLADTAHRQIKYLNNVIEADHGKLKRLIKPILGFKSRKTAYATIKGFEVMRALKKGQAKRSRSNLASKVRPVLSSAPLAWALTCYQKSSGQGCYPLFAGLKQKSSDLGIQNVNMPIIKLSNIKLNIASPVIAHLIYEEVKISILPSPHPCFNYFMLEFTIFRLIRDVMTSIPI